MKSTLRVENPDSIEMTLNLTMTLGEWKRLSEQLETGEHPGSSPGWDVRLRIKHMVSIADKNFESNGRE